MSDDDAIDDPGDLSGICEDCSQWTPCLLHYGGSRVCSRCFNNWLFGDDEDDGYDYPTSTDFL